MSGTVVLIARGRAGGRGDRTPPVRCLHDYAQILYSHAPMTPVGQVIASNPSQPPVSGHVRQ
jgi:hypothetical protein